MPAVDDPAPDDIVPPPRSDPKPRAFASLALAFALVVAGVVGMGVWLASDRDRDSAPVPRAAPEEDVPDRTARPVEVLGEVVERPPAPSEEEGSDSPPAPTTSTTVRPRAATTKSTTSTTSTTQPRPQDAPPPVDLTITASGTVAIEQYFSPETKEDFEPNADCGSLHEANEVVVRDAAGNEVANAALTGGAYEREEEWGWTVTRCIYDYAVTVPEAESYVFSLAESWDHEAVKDSATVTAEELRRDGAPALRSESRYCPECR